VNDPAVASQFRRCWAASSEYLEFSAAYAVDPWCGAGDSGLQRGVARFWWSMAPRSGMKISGGLSAAGVEVRHSSGCR